MATRCSRKQKHAKPAEPRPQNNLLESRQKDQCRLPEGSSSESLAQILPPSPLAAFRVNRTGVLNGPVKLAILLDKSSAFEAQPPVSKPPSVT